MAKAKDDKTKTELQDDAAQSAAEEQLDQGSPAAPEKAEADAIAPEPPAAEADAPETTAEAEMGDDETQADNAAADADSAEPETPETDGAEALPEEGHADLSVQEHSPDDAPAPEPQVIRETVVERKGGTGAMLVGGVIAAAVGFGAARLTDIQLPFLPQDDFRAQTTATLSEHAARLADLDAHLARTDAAIAAVDLGPVSESVAQLDAAVSGARTDLDDLAGRQDAADQRVAGLAEQLSALDQRLTALEKAPVAEAVSPEAMAAYEREFEALRNEIAAQRAEIETMAADAVAAQGDAVKQAQRAAARAALADIMTALESGAPYGDALSVLENNGIAAGALQAAAADGVPTSATLLESFPDAARAALAASRGAAEGAEEGGIGSFLKRALGARSVTPRDGDDPDAVLSRAEAALRGGDLTTALDEIATLPEAGQAALADWVAQAETRNAALAAAREIAGQLNAE